MAAHDAPHAADDPDLREKAVDQLRKKQELRAHVLVFTLTNALLWVIWALTMPGGFAWPAIVTAGWSVGLVMNAWDVYGRRPFTEAQVQHEIDRLRRT